MAYSSSTSPLYALLLQGSHLKLPKGQVVNVFDDHARLNLIKSGYVQRYLITDEGAKGIQVIYGPDDIFPLTPVYKTIFEIDIYSGPEQYYYEAMTDLETYSVSQQDLQEAIARAPLLYKDLLYAAGQRLNSYIHRLEDMSLRDPYRRVAHQLAYFASHFSEATPEGRKLTIPLTQQDLADILSINRETVTRVMVRLRQEGLLAAGHPIIIRDSNKLAAIAH